jgi:predicted transcriptional regulator
MEYNIKGTNHTLIRLNRAVDMDRSLDQTVVALVDIDYLVSHGVF